MSIPVSIIVPVYNVENYLRKCLDSIINQTFADFECILVNDASPDNSISICEEYAQKDKRIKIITNEKNMGLPTTRKRGVENALGDYILHVDSDDWIEPTMVEKMYTKAVSENLDVVVCDCFYDKENTTIIRKQRFTSFDKIAIIKKIFSIRINAYLVNKLIKKEMYSNVEFPVYSRSEDYVVIIQIISYANKIGYINVPLYHYRYNALSLSNNIETKIKGRIEENKNWQKIIDFLTNKYGNIEIFNPELTNHINDFKYAYKHDKDLKNIKELFDIYPNSGYNKWLLKKIIKSVLKLVIPQKTLEWIKDKEK